MRCGEGFLLCFSLIDFSSFQEISSYIEKIKKVKGVNHFPGVLVGTKCDLNDERKVQLNDILQFSNESEIPYIETSSKNGVKVDDCFLTLANGK